MREQGIQSDDSALLLATQRGSRWTRSERTKVFVCLVALVEFVFQMLVAGRYGYFSDELYYLACADHLSWGYVDHPPLVAFAMFLTRHVFGTSLYGLRVIPALAGACTVILVAAIARALGGGYFAQVLAGVSVAATPIYMSLFHFFSMNSFEVLIWSGLAYFAVLVVKTANPQYWIAFGILSGLAIENKYSSALFIVALFAGLLFGPARRLPVTIALWIGTGLGVLIAIPNFLWQKSHGFPFLAWQMALRRSGGLIHFPVSVFLAKQVVLTGTTVLIWMVGIYFLLFDREGKRFRFAGVGTVIVISVFMLLRSKLMYPAPVYGLPMAAGAVFWEKFTRNSFLARAGLVAFLVIPAAILAPCFVPILPIDRVPDYETRLHLSLPIQTEKYEIGEKLPMQFAFETGWEDLVAQVAKVYAGLSVEERAKTGILTFYYGDAAAIDFFGPRYGLPHTISTHLSYHLWGTHGSHGDVLIMVGDSLGPKDCETFQWAAVLHDPYMLRALRASRPTVNVCRGLKFDLERDWPSLQGY